MVGVKDPLSRCPVDLVHNTDLVVGILSISLSLALLLNLLLLLGIRLVSSHPTLINDLRDPLFIPWPLIPPMVDTQLKGTLVATSGHPVNLCHLSNHGEDPTRPILDPRLLLGLSSDKTTPMGDPPTSQRRHLPVRLEDRRRRRLEDTFLVTAPPLIHSLELSIPVEDLQTPPAEAVSRLSTRLSQPVRLFPRLEPRSRLSGTLSNMVAMVHPVPAPLTLTSHESLLPLTDPTVPGTEHHTLLLLFPLLNHTLLLLSPLNHHTLLLLFPPLNHTLLLCPLKCLLVDQLPLLLLDLPCLQPQEHLIVLDPLPPLLDSLLLPPLALLTA